MCGASSLRAGQRSACAAWRRAFLTVQSATDYTTCAPAAIPSYLGNRASTDGGRAEHHARWSVCSCPQAQPPKLASGQWQLAYCTKIVCANARRCCCAATQHDRADPAGTACGQKWWLPHASSRTSPASIDLSQTGRGWQSWLASPPILDLSHRTLTARDRTLCLTTLSVTATPMAGLPPSARAPSRVRGWQPLAAACLGDSTSTPKRLTLMTPPTARSKARGDRRALATTARRADRPRRTLPATFTSTGGDGVRASVDAPATAPASHGRGHLTRSYAHRHPTTQVPLVMASGKSGRACAGNGCWMDRMNSTTPQYEW